MVIRIGKLILKKLTIHLGHFFGLIVIIANKSPDNEEMRNGDEVDSL